MCVLPHRVAAAKNHSLLSRSGAQPLAHTAPYPIVDVAFVEPLAATLTTAPLAEEPFPAACWPTTPDSPAFGPVLLLSTAAPWLVEATS